MSKSPKQPPEVGYRALLSVVIPTYNRQQSLLVLLRQLLKLRKRYPFDISVTDNASEKSSSEVIQSFCLENEVCYSRNENNLGIDRNMEIAYGMGGGKYVWAISDDETIFEDRFEDLFERLSNDADLILLKGVAESKYTAGRKQKHVEYYKPVDAFRDYWGATTFGLLVFRRDLISDVNFKRYYGSYHGYVAVLWEGLAQQFKEMGSVKIQALLEPVVCFHPQIEKTWKGYNCDVYYRAIPFFFKELDSHYGEVAKWFSNYYMRKNLSFYTIAKFTAGSRLTENELDAICSEMKPNEERKFRRVCGWPMTVKKLVAMSLRYIPISLRNGFYARHAYNKRFGDARPAQVVCGSER